MATFYLDPEGGNDANAGTSFALRWRTITAGPTAARIGPGDVIRIMATPDPTSLGVTGLWTHNSGTITLSSALTANIDVCDAAWTASANVTATANAANRKQGTACCRLAIAAAFTTGKVAFHLVPGGTTDFSAYQQVSFWIKANAALASGIFELRLCSDATGDTTVNTVAVPAIPSPTCYIPVTVNLGGALGSSIQSVSLFALVDPGTVTVDIDNILAVKAPGNDALSLTSLIGKGIGGETYWPIRSINGTSVRVDQGWDNVGATDGVYGGTTETVPAYKREPLYRNEATIEEVQDSGTVGSLITFSGGWNRTDMSTQTGETWWANQRDQTTFYINAKPYIRLEKLNLMRGFQCLLVISPTNLELEDVTLGNSSFYGLYLSWTTDDDAIVKLMGRIFMVADGSNGIIGESAYYIVYQLSGTLKILGSLGDAITFNGMLVAVHVEILAGGSSGLSSGASESPGLYVIDRLIVRNKTSAIDIGGTGEAYINTFITSGNSWVASPSGGGKIYSRHSQHPEASLTNYITPSYRSAYYLERLNGNPNDHRGLFPHGTITSVQDANRHTLSGIAWKMSPTTTTTTDKFPMIMPLARFAVKANALVTLSVWAKRTDSALTGKLVVRGGQIAGVTNDVEKYISEVNVYEQLIVTFTPTEKGVLEAEVHAYGGTTHSLYIDDYNVVQA